LVPAKGFETGQLLVGKVENNGSRIEGVYDVGLTAYRPASALISTNHISGTCNCRGTQSLHTSVYDTKIP